MKKIFTILQLLLCMQMSWSQVSRVAINELYVAPSGGRSEFFEFYNNSSAGSFSLDTFSILTYWDNGLSGPAFKQGFYVLDLPNVVIPSFGFVVGASASPFDFQTSCSSSPVQGTAQINWNSLPASGSLKLWVQGTANLGDGNPNYDEMSISGLGSTFNDLFFNKGGGGFNYAVLVFRYRGVTGSTELINSFFGGYVGTTLPAAISGMPSLNVTMNIVAANYSINFATLPNVVEQVNASAGTDNGYRRTGDGQCGKWEKSSSGCEHTPGSSNGTITSTGSLTTETFTSCAVFPAYQTSANYNIVAGPASAFPVEVQVWEDTSANGSSTGLGLLDINSVFRGGSAIGAARPAGTFDNVTFLVGDDTSTVLYVYITDDGCSDQLDISECIVLPVSYLSFEASRSGTSVALKWQTATESNNSGFEVQRKTGTSDFQTIGFVKTLAPFGNSNSILHYQFTEINDFKGISQYRLRQVDFDGKYSYSVVRAVKGLASGTGIVVYPNPSQDGRISIMLEKADRYTDVSIYDMQGRIIRQWSSVQTDILQTDRLYNGVYSVRVTNRQTGNVSVQKFVVKH